MSNYHRKPCNACSREVKHGVVTQSPVAHNCPHGKRCYILAEWERANFGRTDYIKTADQLIACAECWAPIKAVRDAQVAARGH